MDTLDREIDNLYRDIVEEGPEAGASLSDDDEPEPERNAPPVEADASMEPDCSTDECNRLTPPPESDLGTSVEPVADDAESAPRPATLLPFPVEVFPTQLQRFIREGAAAMQCAPEFFGVPMLAVAGVAVGNGAVLQVKPGWREGPRIYAAVVAPPGSAKSPALRAVMEPLHVLQDRLSERLYTSDATTEALAALLQANPRGLLYGPDELVAWVRAMDQYRTRKGADRQFWLSNWSGERVIVDRKSSEFGPIIVPAPFVNVIGGLTPDCLSDLGDADGRQEGFLDRILFASPLAARRGSWTTATISPYARQSWALSLQYLRQVIEPEVIEDGPCPVVLRFTPDGQAEWVRFYNAHAVEEADLPPTLRGPWAKLMGYCARFALLIHLLRVACGEVKELAVDGESVRRAVILVDYFKSQARRVYRRMPTPGDKREQQVLAWVRRQGGKASVRDLYTNQVAGLKKPDEAKAMLLRLQQRGHGVLADEGRNRLVFHLAEA